MNIPRARFLPINLLSNMKSVWTLLLALSIWQIQCMAQRQPENLPAVSNEKFDAELKRLLSFSVPVVGVSELQRIQGRAVVLDARARTEFETSHLPLARYVGYETFSLDALSDLPRDTTIVVYCSVGYRSERIAEKLKEAGFEKVYNLYGGIFEWVNRGFPLYDRSEKSTRRVHTYNKRWSKWVTNPEFKKIW